MELELVPIDVDGESLYASRIAEETSS